MRGHSTPPPSNVARIGWAIKDTSRDGIPQVVHYIAGVGSTGGTVQRVLRGAVGSGLQENVREAYSFIAMNWRQGDEIFLLGFSRGAFTARSVAGMIAAVGLLTRAGLPDFSEIYEDFEHRNRPRYIPKQPDVPFPDKPPFSDPNYVAELERRGLTRLRVRIKVVGVWDTVGSLGIPHVPWLEAIGLQSRKMKEYAFDDTTLSDWVENAFQALALDEHRAPFSPAVWEKSKSCRTNLRQVWFPGVHSNIGGGYDDQELANITLAWMMSRLEPMIDFRLDYIMLQYDQNKQYYRNTGQKTRWWSFGEILDSAMGIYMFSGSTTRTPGDYYRTDMMTGRPTNKRLKNTNEYIHASVRSRTGLDGPGLKDRGVYTSKALQGWEFIDESTEAGEPQVVWEDRSGREGGLTTIPEAVLLETERRLLSMTPRVEDYVLDMKAPKKNREKRRSRRKSS